MQARVECVRLVTKSIIDNLGMEVACNAVFIIRLVTKSSIDNLGMEDGVLPGFPSNTIRRRVDSRQVEPRGVGGAEEEDLLSFSSKKFDFKQLESVLGGVDSPSWVTPPC